MSKLIIMQGLPASGKSTRAKEIMVASGNTYRINKDLLRKMLHFDVFTNQHEMLTRDCAETLARMMLVNQNVIIDDTNLNKKTFDSWVSLAAELACPVQIIDMETPYAKCVERDNMRVDSVGRNVIFKMALQSGRYPKPDKPFVICDIDGTIANIEHRLHHVKKDPKDWTAFFESSFDDKVRMDVRNILKGYASKGYEVIYVSARPDTYEWQTELWLAHYECMSELNVAGIIMRPAGDRRPDTEVKHSIYDRYFKDKYPIEVVIDDRPSVIRMWRSNGLQVNDVGKGIEF